MDKIYYYSHGLVTATCISSIINGGLTKYPIILIGLQAVLLVLESLRPAGIKR